MAGLTTTPAAAATAGGQPVSVAVIQQVADIAQDDVGAPTLNPGDTLAFFDGFNGSNLDTSKWLYTNGTAYPGGPPQFGTWEKEVNQEQNTAVGNGILTITPTRDEITQQWYSSRLESIAGFLPAAGQSMLVSGRIAMPAVTGVEALGYWPAFWMLSSEARNDRWSWPRNGEVDIMESVNGLNWSNSVFHCDVWGGACADPEGINTEGLPCGDTHCWGNFHIFSYTLDRTSTPEVLRWYIDGVQTLEVRQDDPRFAGKSTWADMVAFSMNIIANVAIDGVYPEKKGQVSTPATKSGAPMRIDWISVIYSGTGTQPPPTVPPVVTPPVTPPPVTQPPVVTPPVVTPPPATTPPVPPATGPTDLVNDTSRVYSAVDFGSAPLKALKLHLVTEAVPGVSGTIEAHLDSATGPLIGSSQSIGYGFSTTWTDIALDTSATGVHDIVVTAVSGQPEPFGKIDYALVG